MDILDLVEKWLIFTLKWTTALLHGVSDASLNKLFFKKEKKFPLNTSPRWGQGMSTLRFMQFSGTFVMSVFLVDLVTVWYQWDWGWL